MTEPPVRPRFWLTGLVALAASLPALSIPFLADDWANLRDISSGHFTKTAFGYFRPLYLGSLWLDLQAWGQSPVAFHATNVVLIALAAALVVLVAGKYGASPGVAALAGVIFALHPYHVETAGWIAARGDALYCVFLLLAFLAYERWARGTRSFPLLALALFETALLCKEAAVAFPLLLSLLCLSRPSRNGARVSRREVWRGLVPLALLAPLHFFVVRRLALGGTGVSGPADLGLPWVKRFVHFVIASVLPLHIERIDANPRTLAVIAAGLIVLLFVLAYRRAGDDRRLLLIFSLGFVLAIGPSLLSFQSRYLFFPSVFSSVVLACVLSHILPRPRAAIAAVLVVVWGACLSEQWSGWIDAGRVSRNLVAGLTITSLDTDLTEIVVANMPYRVHGAPVAGALPTAVELSGGRRISIRAATSVDLPSSALDGLAEWSPEDVHVRMPSGLFARVFLPPRPAIGIPLNSDWGTVTFDGPGSAHVRLEPRPDGSRRAFVWSRGALEQLF